MIGWFKYIWHKYGVWFAYERIENNVRMNGDFKEDTVIYRTYYLSLTHHCMLWIVRKTRSGAVSGDYSLRLWTQEYTKQYNGIFERIKRRPKRRNENVG